MLEYLKGNKIFICIMVSVLFISIGFSYAFFGIIVEGNDTSKVIEGLSSSVSITYTDNDTVLLNNAYPGDGVYKTLYVENTGTTPTYYAFEWHDLVNEFLDNDIILSMVCSVVDSNDIPNEDKECNYIERTVAYSATSSTQNIKSSIYIEPGEIHKYNVFIMFLETLDDQSENMNKSFSGKIAVVDSKAYPTLADVIFRDNVAYADNVSSEFVTSSSGINFFSNSSDSNGKGLYYTTDTSKTEDNDGDGLGERVYYFRGAVENNYLVFANYCWRIVRTTENNGIKLRYSGAFENGVCPQTGTETQAFKSSINSSQNDNAYLGYMYGNLDCTFDEDWWEYVCESSSYEQAHANINDSNIKKRLDKWFESFINKQGSLVYDNVIDTIYCNDRSVPSDYGYTGTSTYEQLGYGTSNTLYGASVRENKKIVQYKCPQQNDAFTLSVEAGGTEGYGNNDLSYPIGLLTVDEVRYSGLTSNANSTNFLSAQFLYWLMSPEFYNFGYTSYFDVRGTDINSFFAYQSYNVLPVITLNPNINVLSGIGTYNDPYVLD